MKQLVFNRVAGLQSQRYTYLDRLSKLLKLTAVKTVEYNLPTNFIQNKFYRRCSAKGTEQCCFVKRLSILIAREHKKMCPFTEKFVDVNCILVYNNIFCFSIMISVTFLDVADVLCSLLKVKLNFKICTGRKPLLILVS